MNGRRDSLLSGFKSKPLPGFRKDELYLWLLSVTLITNYFVFTIYVWIIHHVCIDGEGGLMKKHTGYDFSSTVQRGWRGSEHIFVYILNRWSQNIIRGDNHCGWVLFVDEATVCTKKTFIHCYYFLLFWMLYISTKRFLQQKYI